MNYTDKQEFGPNCIGQVIRILSDKELIVDVGDDYLTIGDTVIIYAVGDEIFDLDGNSLGVYEFDKATLEVITTTSTYSVCSTPKTTKVSSAIVDYTNLFSKETVVQEDLNINKNDIEAINIENKSIIVKGDLGKKY